MATAYLTYSDLARINAASVKAKRNRTLFFDRLPIKDDGTRYPVVWSMLHNDVEIRARIVLNPKGVVCDLDMSFDDFDGLKSG